MGKVLPIVEGGHLKPEATFLVLGYMFHPNDERAAHQLANLIREEFEAEAKGYPPSELVKIVYDKYPLNHLRLAGEMSLLVADNIREKGKPFISKAAFTVSEHNSTNVGHDGGKLATSENTIRRNFSKYSAVAHLWAAYSLDKLTNEHSDASEFLSLSEMFLQVFQEANFSSPYEPWQIPMFKGLKIYEWPEGGLVENPEAVQEILKSYISRSGD